MPEQRPSQSSARMPGLAEWLEWIERDDQRFRDQAIKGLAAHRLEKVLAERAAHRDPGLTPHGMAYVAASVAIVLTDRDHSEHERVVDGFRRELAGGTR